MIVAEPAALFKPALADGVKRDKGGVWAVENWEVSESSLQLLASIVVISFPTDIVDHLFDDIGQTLPLLDRLRKVLYPRELDGNLPSDWVSEGTSPPCFSGC